EPFEGSVTRKEDVAKATKDVEVIYHLAGKVSFAYDGAAQMNKIHVEGTRLLCEAAKENGVKNFILASSSGTSAITEDGKIVDETYPQPVHILVKWPYYASKYYQEKTALRIFDGKGLRLVILNPSLLLGSGDDRLSSTKVVLDFMARKFPYTPSGGINFVDVRDAAEAFFNAIDKGRHRERYLLGAVNWTVAEFFERLEILTGVSAPMLKIPKKIAIAGSNLISTLYKTFDREAPFEASEVEMGEYFWYFDSSKAKAELGFSARDPMETLQETVKFLRENFLGKDIFS
ncbi:MAG: NAD-dependent epimerase/dehydratase family protein, partial [Pyrinomonadaceae bacterium]